MKIKKCVLTLIVAVAVMAGFTLGAGSANVRQTITATLRPDLNIEVDGAKQSLKDAAGNPVYPIVYNNSTYVPFRAVGDLLGVEVGWDQDTQTAKYITNGTPATKPEPDKPVVKGVDLIDDCELAGRGPDGWGYEAVQTTKEKQIKVGDKVLDHWLRMTLSYSRWDGGSYWVIYNLPGGHNTLNLSCYASYDTHVTVFNNATKDSILGEFDVAPNKASTYKVDVDGAVQIVLQVTANKKVGENDHIYFYDAYLQ